MITRASFVLIFLLLLPGHGNTQSPTAPVTPSGPYPPPAALGGMSLPSNGNSQLPRVVSGVQPQASSPIPISYPQFSPSIPQGGPYGVSPSVQSSGERSLDQMMDELVAIRTQKAEILKKEKEAVRAIQERAVRQSDRIKSMGISVPPAPTIDQIGTRANDKPADDAILHEILACRGEVLEPALLERLRKLAKAATPRLEIEVTPRAGAPEVVDLLIKVVEEEK